MAASGSAEAIESEAGEQVRETSIEYEGGESLRCTYTVNTSRVRTELVQEMTSFTISTDQGEIDLFEVLKIKGAISVKIVARGDSEFVQMVNRDGDVMRYELRIPEPKTPEDFALFLHEVGHFAQNMDEDSSSERRMNQKEYMRLIKGGQEVAKKGFNGLSHEWSRVHNIFPRIPRTVIRKRFQASFDRFVSELPQLDELFGRFYELEVERSDLEGIRLMKDSDLLSPANQASEREKELSRLIDELIPTIPIQEILFFLTEPIRHYERDATRRAVVWLKSFGEHLKISALSRLDDVGTRHLFSNLDTYSHGCVKGVIDEGSEGASV